MRITLLLVFAAALIGLCLAVPKAPSGDGSTRAAAPADLPAAQARASGQPCRILVELGTGSRLDRGTLLRAEPTTVLVGTYRYWTEPTGPVLYVWDDVQNLTARILNPSAVRVVPD